MGRPGVWADVGGETLVSSNAVSRRGVVESFNLLATQHRDVRGEDVQHRGHLTHSPAFVHICRPAQGTNRCFRQEQRGLHQASENRVPTTCLTTSVAYPT